MDRKEPHPLTFYPRVSFIMTHTPTANLWIGRVTGNKGFLRSDLKMSNYGDFWLQSVNNIIEKGCLLITQSCPKYKPGEIVIPPTGARTLGIHVTTPLFHVRCRSSSMYDPIVKNDA